MKGREGIRSILLGVFALNWIMEFNPSEAFIIYCCTPYVW